jgi:hypothetical protein
MNDGGCVLSGTALSRVAMLAKRGGSPRGRV